VRDPSKIEDPHKWLLDTIQSEIEKVKALIDRSAEGYFLLTNVSGTAHLDVGSIDKVQRTLTEKLTDGLGLPTQCWWRDDLERRLDGAWSVKWAYPEVMTGPDFLRAIIETGVSQESVRRERALQAFLRGQYSRDSEVRFRQVDLQNGLLDLFVDVPIGITSKRSPTAYHLAAHEAFEQFRESSLGFRARQSDQPSMHVELDEHGSPERAIGAASFLLSTGSRVPFDAVVLEGAPGQGKSTITQYVCQVYRIRLLREVVDLERIPEDHRTGPIRLPIRVDLRDFALWRNGKNPFQRGVNGEPALVTQTQLEPFLAALVTYHSGGASFSVDDLLAILPVTAVCVVLDGLDEVVDIETRASVVEEVMSAQQRLSQNSAALQIVVTSRPAAFLNSPGLPEGKFAYLSLKSLTAGSINKYVELWGRARRVGSAVEEELRDFVRTRLAQPHIRQLARNPMQLAILLSLVHRKGLVLPDQRTALYTAYIDHFMGREAEKSAVVRAHQEVLLELHRYLAWIMQSEAEERSEGGSISQERLLEVVGEYLERDGRSRDVARLLFQGMIERVVVLVSRVQGTFEFEVQPLREYFAGCYLYETAPLSRPGSERSGARPDRFDALARRSYWLNVCRFYAGCYSKGEIASLVDGLRDLFSDPKVGPTAVPRKLAVALVSDWVFAQVPRAATTVVELLTEEQTLGRLLAEVVSQDGQTEVVFAEETGRTVLIERCFALLTRKLLPYEYENALLRVMCVNRGDGKRLVELWELARPGKSSEGLARWLRWGRIAGALQEYSTERLIALSAEAKDEEVRELYWAGRIDVLTATPPLFIYATQMLVGGRLRGPSINLANPLKLLETGLYGELFAHASRTRWPVSMGDAMRRLDSNLGVDWVACLKDYSQLPDFERFLKFADALATAIKLPVTAWASSLEPWSIVSGTAVQMWGEGRAVRLFGLLAAATRVKGKGKHVDAHMLGVDRPLCYRARYARLSASSSEFWGEQLGAAKNGEDRIFVLLAMCAWCPVDVLAKRFEDISGHLDCLSTADWQWLTAQANRVRERHVRAGADGAQLLSGLPGQITVRAASLFAELGDADLRPELTKRILPTEGDKSWVAETQRISALADCGRLGSKKWSPDLDSLARVYPRGIAFLDPRVLPHGRISRGTGTVKAETLTRLLTTPYQFPPELVYYAGRVVGRSLAKEGPTVGEVAIRQNWFLPSS